MPSQLMPQSSQQRGPGTVGSIVVAFDATQPGRRTLQWAVCQAEHSGAPLHVVCTRSTPDEGDDYPFDAGDSERAWLVRGLVDGLAVSATDGTASCDLTVVVTSEDPMLALIRESNVSGSVLVLGCQQVPGEPGASLDEFSNELLLRSNCAVVVVPPRAIADDGDGPAQAIVVSVDGSEASECALRFAAAQAVTQRCRLLVLAMVTTGAGAPIPAKSDGPDLDADVVLGRATQLLEPWRGELGIDTGVWCDTPQSIVESQARNSQLLVFGAAGAAGAVSHSREPHDRRFPAHPETIMGKE